MCKVHRAIMEMRYINAIHYYYYYHSVEKDTETDRHSGINGAKRRQGRGVWRIEKTEV